MSKELIERLRNTTYYRLDPYEAADRIEQLQRRIEYLELCCDEGERQLAASQAREQQLREALSACVCAMQDYQAGIGITELFDKGERLGRLVLLSEKQDTTALEAMIQKAGDVAVAKARQACIDLGAKGIDYFNYTSFVEAIDKLPTVTLKDLK